MPLSPAQPRRPLHTRNVRYEAFARNDSLCDINAHIVDTKPLDYPLSAVVRSAGEPVHEMWVRVTIDRHFVIRDIEAATDWMPYPEACDRITPEYRKLIGTSLIKGFRKTLHDRLGHVHGCTHITEMLSYLPTAAVQTFAGLVRDNDDSEHKPFQLDRCHALETTTETVRRFYPKWYRGTDQSLRP